MKQLQNADSMSFLSRKEVDADISSLSDKFNFHGFCSQASDLQKVYSKVNIVCYVGYDLTRVALFAVYEERC